jgi:hypothetical protein
VADHRKTIDRNNLFDAANTHQSSIHNDGATISGARGKEIMLRYSGLSGLVVTDDVKKPRSVSCDPVVHLHK